MTDRLLIEQIRSNAIPLTNTTVPHDHLARIVRNAEVVLIGEASHGTHEFYSLRCEITKWLITEAGFNAVAIEGDWPDTYRINRFVRGDGEDQEGIDALEGFERFPTWMWRNVDVLDFIGWLRDHNERRPHGRGRVGFYGLDLYSLFTSAQAVIRYLDEIDPELARDARHRYGCLSGFGLDEQAYAFGVARGMHPSCMDEVLQQLLALQNKRAEYLARDGRLAAEEQFAAERNAWAVLSAEEYYRTMLGADVRSWNLRDSHMMETLKAVMGHLKRNEGEAKVVVWAHNSHIGDARATEMSRRGELNIGQLAREEFGSRAVSIGMSTFEGTVTAAVDWDMPAMRMRLRPALVGSYEALFHSVGLPEFILPLKGYVAELLDAERLERAVGVIYRPATERASHYFRAHLSRQFDALIHIDHTRALEPLERLPAHHTDELPETYPSSL